MKSNQVQRSLELRNFQVHSYKTKFSAEWKKTWPFISAVPHSFRCNVCAKNLSCAHQGKSDIKDHIAGKNHIKLSKAAASQPKLYFRSETDTLFNKVSMHVLV